MSLINTEILPFKATAFHNGDFVDVSEADLKGKWSVVSFTRLTLLLFARLSWVTLRITTIS